MVNMKDKSMKRLLSLLDMFNNQHMNTYALTLSSRLDIRNNFEEEYPNGDSPGVYVMSNEKDEIVRIGQTGTSFNKRLNSYFEWFENPSSGVPATKEGKDVQYVRTIPFTNGIEYMRLSLEAYLIINIKPQNNILEAQPYKSFE